MSTLNNKKIQDTYPDLLTVLGSTNGEGLTSSVKRIFDGDGTGSPLWIGTTSLEMTGTAIVSGILNLQEKSSAPSSPTAGDLAFINDELYIASNS